MQAAAAFLEALVGAVPYRIHTVLTDNGIQFANLPKNRGGLTARWRGHPFDRICLRHGIGHRLTQPNHPWTNGQVERMNRTIKEATVKRFFYDTHEQLKAHLSDFIAAYNFARRLKTLRGLTPYEAICKLWTHDPDRFTLDPIHQMSGLNSLCFGPPGIGKTLSAWHYSRAELIVPLDRWSAEARDQKPIDTVLYTTSVINSPSRVEVELHRAREILSNIAPRAMRTEVRLKLDAMRPSR